ncbi:amino acid permease [Tatumella sp. TA1]|uniref:basic amino acid/polyamine antiporter n=1 Tax=Rosenbergiella collisarenosi TaxID=1544695 RepID=UPI0008F8A28F|nr:basic amino acid/polyamine antiporter [Rosenbergiella collisarenosi]MBT0720819.1 amino acid permease [Rosenbergiella collisarenosi]QGX91451.1 amino acid permease [Tatumella sp. TA1]
MTAKKLGVGALTALVLSSMLGAGVFSLPQNMAAVSGSEALIIGWSITGIGILFLATAMLYLSRLRPDLDGGIFTYAEDGFGKTIGFLSAWGYWLCAVIANVSYLVVVFSALSFFTDSPGHVLFGEGNTWQSMLGASILLWVIHGLVARGVQTAASINILATFGKLVPLALFIVLGLLHFDYRQFSFDFSGMQLHLPVWAQVKQTMLITLWVFIGVEGAVVVSGRAKNKEDIGKATLFAVIAALSVYLLVTILSLGIIPRDTLANMKNPSMGGLLAQMIGPYGYWIIVGGIILSVSGAYLSWTIMAAEIPFIAAKRGAFPKLIAAQNTADAPIGSLWMTNISVQACLIAIAFFHLDYSTLLTIASEMVLVPYLLVGLFLTKVCYQARNYSPLLIGIGATLYGLWLIYASGLTNLLMSLTLYAPGLMVFLFAAWQHRQHYRLRTLDKLIILTIITSGCIIALTTL